MTASIAEHFAASERRPFTKFATKRTHVIGNAPTEDREEVCNLEGAGRWVCLTQQPSPVPGCVTVQFHSACAPRLLRGHGRTYPHTVLSRTLCRLLLRGWPGRPSPSWTPFFGGRQSAALPDWSCFGAQRLGKAATWCSQVVFLPASTKRHVP